MPGNAGKPGEQDGAGLGLYPLAGGLPVRRLCRGLPAGAEGVKRSLAAGGEPTSGCQLHSHGFSFLTRAGGGIAPGTSKMPQGWKQHPGPSGLVLGWEGFELHGRLGRGCWPRLGSVATYLVAG